MIGSLVCFAAYLEPLFKRNEDISYVYATNCSRGFYALPFILKAGKAWDEVGTKEVLSSPQQGQ